MIIQDDKVDDEKEGERERVCTHTQEADEIIIIMIHYNLCVTSFSHSRSHTQCVCV